MGTFWFWFWVITAVLTVVVLLMPWMLKKRGVTMTHSRFGTTLIFDSEDADGTPVRLLNVGGTFQSVSYISPELRFELACVYHRDMAALIEELAVTKPGVRVLIMGGGGYSLPKYVALHLPEANVTVVEFDPKITQIAKEQFFLDEALASVDARGTGTLELVAGDAWAYLKDTNEHFDVIVNDAFSGKRPLGPMKTDEGAALVAERLSCDGMYLANVRSSLTGRNASVLRDVEAAFGAVFAKTLVLPEWPDAPEKKGNNVFAASRCDFAVLNELKQQQHISG